MVAILGGLTQPLNPIIVDYGRSLRIVGLKAPLLCVRNRSWNQSFRARNRRGRHDATVLVDIHTYRHDPLNMRRAGKSGVIERREMPQLELFVFDRPILGRGDMHCPSQKKDCGKA